MLALRKNAIENARKEGLVGGENSSDDERDERVGHIEMDDADKMVRYVWKDIIAHENDQI
jgi:hypothetical protein